MCVGATILGVLVMMQMCICSLAVIKHFINFLGLVHIGRELYKVIEI